MLVDLCRKRSEEFKDACIRPLVFPERLVIHEQIHQVPATIEGAYPLHMPVRMKGVFAPFTRAEAKRDIIRQAIILEEDLYLTCHIGTARVLWRPIEKVGTPPTEYVRLYAKEVPELVRVQFDLPLEFLP